MELRHLRYFVAVAEELSFTMAAQRLHTAQPSLSQQIRQLEQDVGTPLLERNKRRVQLTSAGRVFLRESRAILRRVDEAIELSASAAAGKAGELSIAADQAAQITIVPKTVPLLVKRLPNVKLTIHNLGYMEQIAALRDYSIDAGFLRGPVHEPDLCTEPLLYEKIIVVLPSKHPLAKMKGIPIRMLDNLPCITISRSIRQPVRDLVAGIYQQSGIRVRSVIEADTLLTHLELVAAGLGYTLLPEYVSSILPRGVITRPLIWNPAPRSSIDLIFRKGDNLPSLLNLKDIVRECFGPRGSK